MNNVMDLPGNILSGGGVGFLGGILLAGNVDGLYLLTIDGQPAAGNVLTTNPRPTLTGYVRLSSGSSGIVIHFKMPNGTEDGTATTDSSGNWTYTYSQDLPSGTYDLTDLITSELPNGSVVNDTVTVDDPISFIGAVTGTISATLPAHQAGDLIIAAIFRDGGTFTVPSGWTQIVSNAQSAYSAILYYKVAASSSETTGSWTSATDVAFAVYRGAHQAAPIGGSSVASGASGTLNRTSFTQVNTDSSSWVCSFVVCRNTAQSPSFGSNYTQRATHENATATSEIWFADTNAPVNAPPSGSITTGGQTCSYLCFEIKSHG
ncbi:hypothetical protein EVC30_044 [Rhizobium phage RHph_Y1_11]|nr:hypothetical protein EVC30_044 [Rhizobium phage RHph_Y1_11]